jgi:hypothetical protein
LIHFRPKNSHGIEFSPVHHEEFVTIQDDEVQPSRDGIEVPLNLVPASILLHKTAMGIIRAPAIKIEMPHSQDVWLFLLRSGWTPGRPTFATPMLSVVHGADVATVSLHVGIDDEIMAEVVAPSSGFTRVDLMMRKAIVPSDKPFDGGRDPALEEIIGSVQPGQTNTFAWRPKTLNFEALFAFYSALTVPQLVDFVQNIGAKVGDHTVLGTTLANDFIAEGPGMTYTLKLSGIRMWMPAATDETIVTFPTEQP